MSSNSNPLRIAVIGVGSIGRRHLSYLAGDADFAAAAAVDPDPAVADFAHRHGIPWFAQHSAMLDAVEVDGVVVATPNALHEQGAVACFERSIPVLIEKPVAHTLESARRIAEAARRTRVPVLVGHHRRHNPLLRCARDFLRGGGIGRLVTVAACDLRRKPDAYYEAAWRREPGGGPLLINGIHDLDCLRWLCGDIEEVFAIASHATRGFAVEDTMAVSFRFANGALGTLTLSDAVQAPWAWEIASGEEPDYPHQREDTYLLCGTAGSLAVPTLTFWRNEHGGGRGDPFVRRQLACEHADPWLEELRHFGQVIREGVTPVTTVEDAALTLATALAIARSAETGTRVSVDRG